MRPCFRVGKPEAEVVSADPARKCPALDWIKNHHLVRGLLLFVGNGRFRRRQKLCLCVGSEWWASRRRLGRRLLRRAGRPSKFPSRNGHSKDSHSQRRRGRELCRCPRLSTAGRVAPPGSGGHGSQGVRRRVPSAGLSSGFRTQVRMGGRPRGSQGLAGGLEGRPGTENYPEQFLFALPLRSPAITKLPGRSGRTPEAASHHSSGPCCLPACLGPPLRGGGDGSVQLTSRRPGGHAGRAWTLRRAFATGRSQERAASTRGRRPAGARRGSGERKRTATCGCS